VAPSADFKVDPSKTLFEQGFSIKQVSPFLYPVFNAGPRLCLGRSVALNEAKTFLSMVLTRFRVDVDQTFIPAYVPSLTLTMKLPLTATISAL